jgi:hypothetical protein
MGVYQPDAGCQAELGPSWCHHVAEERTAMLSNVQPCWATYSHDGILQRWALCLMHVCQSARPFSLTQQ